MRLGFVICLSVEQRNKLGVVQIIKSIIKLACSREEETACCNGWHKD